MDKKLEKTIEAINEELKGISGGRTDAYEDATKYNELFVKLSTKVEQINQLHTTHPTEPELTNLLSKAKFVEHLLDLYNPFKPS